MHNELSKKRALPSTWTGFRYFRFVNGTSKKFWNVFLCGEVVTVSWGRVGSAAREKTTYHAGDARARSATDVLITGKLAAGYVEQAQSNEAPDDSDVAPEHRAPKKNGEAKSRPLARVAAARARLVRGKVTKASDLAKVLDAFARIEAKGYVALPNAAETTSACWDEVWTVAIDAERAAFWNQQSHESFDTRGKLVSPLPIHWLGKKLPVVRALEEVGFEVDVPASPADCIIVHPR